MSGSCCDRPEFEKAVNSLSAGDQLVVWRLDRMSRSLKHLIEINEHLKSKDAYFESLTEKIDTSNPMGEFVFHILGAVAQLELAMIRERTLAGLHVARTKGHHPGRPRKLSDEQLVYAADSLITCHQHPNDLAKELGVHPQTIKRNLIDQFPDIFEHKPWTS